MTQASLTWLLRPNHCTEGSTPLGYPGVLAGPLDPSGDTLIMLVGRGLVS